MADATIGQKVVSKWTNVGLILNIVTSRPGGALHSTAGVIITTSNICYTLVILVTDTR